MTPAERESSRHDVEVGIVESIKRTATKIKEGWQDKAKGLLQVLWERGLIDGANPKKYTMGGKKDAFGNIDLSTSLPISWDYAMTSFTKRGCFNT